MYGAAAAAALLEEASRVEGAADLDLVGRCALRLGLRDDARALLERAFERATTLDLRSRVAYHRFTAAETLEDAMEWAKRAEQLGAGDAAGLMLEAQAQLYARRGQLGDACQILDALIGGTAAGKDDAASLVDVASYHRSRYDCRGDLDDLETAATMLRHAAVLDDGPVVLANQADVLAHAGLVRLLGTGLDTRGLALSSSRPEFLELLAMGGSRQAVLKAARSSPELVEAVALYELLVRRSAADDDQLDWLVRWYELHGSADDLERLGRELPPREPLLVAPCTADPSCVAVLRDGWKRARRIVERAAFTDPRTRAAAAVLLAAAARDVAPVAADGDEPLALAETTLRRSLGRERWSEVALALAQVLVAQVAAGEAASGRQLPPLWPLLAEVEQLRAIGAPADPRLTEAAELVRGAVAAGAPAGRLDARLVALVSEEEGAELLEAWASRPGVLEARAVAAALAPGDPSAVLALADALLGVGEPDDARRVLDDARELGLPIPAALNLD
jgi:tetratricopeptide (TPR) repeat protein